MTPEELAREEIDKMLILSGWVIQNFKRMNPSASLGVAIREFSTSSGPVDYALFVEGKPVGVIEAKRDEEGQNITDVEMQSSRYANSTFKWIAPGYRIRFAYEATSKIIRFTDYKDINYRSRIVFSFFRPERLKKLLEEPDTIRNNMKSFPEFDTTGFRDCQVTAIKNLDKSFSENRPRALVQMATGAGKTFTAITASYRLLKYGKMKRILFLVDTKSLGEQTQREFLAYRPNDDTRSFAELYGVCRLGSSYIPADVNVCISTIQRMYSILKGEPLDEKDEEESEDGNWPDSSSLKEVVYNKEYPPEFFDCIIVDECHRSIYNIWSQVLTYFDAFIIGLTATPDKRTFGFFNQNIVSEYSREQAIIDGVNVGEDIFLIETNIAQNGGTIMEPMVEHRDRLSRNKRWEQLDEEVNYAPSELDRNIVNLSQIRTVIRSFKENVNTSLFPYREEVPKTLIFAKTDSHADDIVQIVRDEFGEGNEFCRKITCRSENPESVLSSFRNDYYPRIAVTVDMIATGTDVKAIECLIFMRDVRSKNYFEQMVGRGTRTLDKEDLQKVSPSATENKDHFVIIDAVGVTKSKKTESRPLNLKPTVSLKHLIITIVLGNRDAETLSSVAARLARLNSKMTEGEKTEFRTIANISIEKIAGNILKSFDEDSVAEKAKEMTGEESPSEEQLKEAQKKLTDEAVIPLYNPDVRDYIEKIRQTHDQIIDNTNIDSVTFAGFDSQREENIDRTISSFHEFIIENIDEITALRIIYNEVYRDRPMVLNELKRLYEKLKAKGITVDRLWSCYSIKNPDKVKRGAIGKITDLISLIRFEMGAEDKLSSFDERVNYNFKQWTFSQNAGNIHFTEEQMTWLKKIRDHIATSLSILPEDLELTPFDSMGGLSKFYLVFGDRYKEILHSLSIELVA